MEDTWLNRDINIGVGFFFHQDMTVHLWVGLIQTNI